MWLYTINMSVFMSLSYVVFPSISALKTNNVDADEQGGTLGALWSIKAMASALAPIVFGAVWRALSSEAPWAVYALASGVAVLGFLVSMSVPDPHLGRGSDIAGDSSYAEALGDVERPTVIGQKAALSEA